MKNVIETLCCARWVQDPDQQKKKKENAILDVSNILRVFEFCAILHVKKITMSLKSLRIVTVALDVHSASAKGAMHSIGGTVESRLKEVRKNDIKLKKKVLELNQDCRIELSKDCTSFTFLTISVF